MIALLQPLEAMAKKKPKPTSALPGTEAKIEVLRLRAEAGQELFHPEDAGLPASLKSSQSSARRTRNRARAGMSKVKLSWKVRIWLPAIKMQVNLGFYKTYQEGIQARDKAKIMFGIKARVINESNNPGFH